MDFFNDAVSYVFQKEGGFNSVREDKGGPTKYGISQAAYPNEDIYSLTLDRAKEIYRRDYWNKNNLGQINDMQKATAALDTVVNHGRGAKLLQEAANRAGANLKVDGAIGPKTIAAINSISVTKFANALYDIRRAYYEKLVEADPSQNVFIKGWLNRIAWLRTHISPVGGSSLAMFALMGVAAYFYFKKT